MDKNRDTKKIFVRFLKIFVQTFIIRDENLRKMDKNRDTKKIFVRFLKIFVQTFVKSYYRYYIKKGGKKMWSNIF